MLKTAHATHHGFLQDIDRLSVARYWYELTDGFWGQFLLTQFPHQYAKELLPREYQHLETMQHFAGALEYLSTWQWHAPTQIKAGDGDERPRAPQDQTTLARTASAAADRPQTPKRSRTHHFSHDGAFSLRRVCESRRPDFFCSKAKLVERPSELAQFQLSCRPGPHSLRHAPLSAAGCLPFLVLPEGMDMSAAAPSGGWPECRCSPAAATVFSGRPTMLR